MTESTTTIKKTDLPWAADKIIRILDGFSWEQQQTVLQFVSRTLLVVGPTELTESDPGDETPELEKRLEML